YAPAFHLRIYRVQPRLPDRLGGYRFADRAVCLEHFPEQEDGCRLHSSADWVVRLYLYTDPARGLCAALRQHRLVCHPGCHHVLFTEDRLVWVSETKDAWS